MTGFIDYYKQIDDGIKDRLRYALRPDFLIDKVDVKVSSNESNLSRGYDYFILTKPGDFPIIDSMNAGKVQTVEWDTTVELFVRFKEKSEQWSLFSSYRDAVIYFLQKYRFLGAAIIDGESVSQVPFVDRIRGIKGNGEADYYKVNNQEVYFMYQALTVTTRQNVKYG